MLLLGSGRSVCRLFHPSRLFGHVHLIEQSPLFDNLAILEAKDIETANTADSPSCRLNRSEGTRVGSRGFEIQRHQVTFSDNMLDVKLHIGKCRVIDFAQLGHQSFTFLVHRKVRGLLMHNHVVGDESSHGITVSGLEGAFERFRDLFVVCNFGRGSATSIQSHDS